MKKIIFFLIISFSFINVFALTYGGCDYSTIARMKSIVSNINISYNYTIIDNEVYFNVTINNLTNDIYMYDTTTKRQYFYSDTNNGEITISNYKVNSGSYKFYSNNNECYGVSLGTKYYSFPKYNRYYTHELCSDIQSYSLCQKWVNINYSTKEFEEMILEYKNNYEEIEEEEATIEYQKSITDVLVEIYINYYYYFLGAIILICSLVIIINNRKNRFKL